MRQNTEVELDHCPEISRRDYNSTFRELIKDDNDRRLQFCEIKFEQPF